MRDLIYILALLAFLALPAGLYAQAGNQFQIGNRFMQQQNYEQALPVFQKLVQENPDEYYFFERYIECYIQLKQYDEALKAIADLNGSPNYQSQINVLKGKLYHFKGDSSRAYSIWEQNIQQSSRNLQIYIATANAMTNVKEFQRSVDILQNARIVFNNPLLFFNEISTTLLQAGNYEGAVREWIAWLVAQPDQTSNIQRTLLRYNDPLLNDITILEIEDKLVEVPITNPAYNTLFRFQVWLLQENKLYRRALASAIAFENSTSNFNYALFQLGRSLRRNKEFELAAQAFQYYIDKANGNLLWQSREELAKVYSEWAKEIDDFNLDFTNKRDALFSKALAELNRIITDGFNYRKMQSVLLLKSEIVLDFAHDLPAAEKTLARLRSINQDVETAEEFYLQGRIHMAKKEYASSRIALTKSNKLAGIGEIAEKTRYFLALTDFFSEDYEFATIQLKSLGRQNTSYYANNALELRLWIHEGLNFDSTGTILKPFAEAIYETTIGNDALAKEKLLAALNIEPRIPLYDDVLLKLSTNPEFSPEESYTLTNAFVEANSADANRERLMWERAKFADEALQKSEKDPAYVITTGLTKSKVEAYYEEIIINYPQGFYAPYARKRLQELSKKNI